MALQTKSASILRQIENDSSQASSLDALMRAIIRTLAEEMPHYNWIGFYMLNQEDLNILELGPYQGATTPHTRIPLNQGICGAAVSQRKTIVVDDVQADPRYLACSIDTKSEIVAPIFVYGIVVGELDIDSHSAAAFGGEDRALVEGCAALVGKFLEAHPQ